MPSMDDRGTSPTFKLEAKFVFVHHTGTMNNNLTVPVQIPLDQSVADLAARLMQAHDLPCFVHDDLVKSLTEFVRAETEKYYDDQDVVALRSVRDSDVTVDDLVERWAQVYNQEVREYVRPPEFNNDDVFSEVYHNLIHSEALETLLNLEHTYAIAVEDIISQRDRDVRHLLDKQGKEMEEAVNKLGGTYTDQQVNKLAQRQFDNTQMIQSKWASELSNLQETQKREYREWVMKVHEDTQAATGTPSYVQRVRALSSIRPDVDDADDVTLVAYQPKMEESFTIHLGAQLKTMHNLRLLCTDVLDLCRHKHNRVGSSVIPSPQRLQTAMSLYSNHLRGLVLLVDNRLSSYTGIKQEFARVCERSTDFHFPNLEQQFAKIERDVVRANEWRLALKAADEADRISVKSAGSASSAQPREDRSGRMQTGDFYITRHSNLSDVHVVYHLVTDETLTQPDISSRHPVILALRNILKQCFRHDVLTITLPLLLVHEMTEEMTVQWCTRRVELVLKCVKGFMMEMATWGGQDSRTVQFLVPKGCSDKMFGEFCTMLPSIFRMSNPVKG